MKKIAASVLLIILFSSAAAFAAKDAVEVRTLLKEKIDNVLEVLEKENLSDREKRGKIEEIVDPVFDYELMAKLALGPRNWPRLSPDQKEIFSKRFIKRVKASYFDKISMYSGDSDAGFEYGAPKTSGDKVHLPVTVRAAGDKIEMIYKFYRSGRQWKIYDVEVGGVSIIQSYRSQFNQVMADGTVEDLLEDLKTADNFQ
ncbi:MAG: ABC transporter substrate-binding protein [Desulfobacteraceae bacterium]|nr:ABC transporter substrate-binding protein [Desulfobacteraceae bacterium]MCF8095573.1 ABC transporter substrate-binding protein [Desulfobacteraceae bacterium]